MINKAAKGQTSHRRTGMAKSHTKSASALGSASLRATASPTCRTVSRQLRPLLWPALAA
jgi:hypothetical protein